MGQQLSGNIIIITWVSKIWQKALVFILSWCNYWRFIRPLQEWWRQKKKCQSDEGRTAALQFGWIPTKNLSATSCFRLCSHGRLWFFNQWTGCRSMQKSWIINKKKIKTKKRWIFTTFRHWLNSHIKLSYENADRHCNLIPKWEQRPRLWTMCMTTL